LPWYRQCNNSNCITISDTYSNDGFALTNSYGNSQFNSDANTYSDHDLTNSITFCKRFSYTDANSFTNYFGNRNCVTFSKRFTITKCISNAVADANTIFICIADTSPASKPNCFCNSGSTIARS
jgi:hypothetical protein